MATQWSTNSRRGTWLPVWTWAWRWALSPSWKVGVIFSALQFSARHAGGESLPELCPPPTVDPSQPTLLTLHQAQRENQLLLREHRGPEWHPGRLDGPATHIALPRKRRAAAHTWPVALGPTRDTVLLWVCLPTCLSTAPPASCPERPFHTCLVPSSYQHHLPSQIRVKFKAFLDVPDGSKNPPALQETWV